MKKPEKKLLLDSFDGIQLAKRQAPIKTVSYVFLDFHEGDYRISFVFFD